MSKFRIALRCRSQRTIGRRAVASERFHGEGRIRTFGQLGHKVVRLYGFTKLVGLLVVRELAGIPSDVRKLRRVLDDPRSEYVRPWTELRWAQDQGELYWQHPDGTWSGDRRPNRMVMTGTLDLKLIRARVRESVKRDPSTLGRIETGRGVLASKPVIAGTRTPVSAIHEYIEAGYGDDAIIEAYPHITHTDRVTGVAG